MPIKPANANLRAELARADVSQADVAELLGVTQPQVSARMLGKIPWRVPELQAIARHLGLPFSRLVDDEPEMTEPEPADDSAMTA